MKKFIGLSLFVIGILLSIYVGVWVMFIGGIIGLVKVVLTIIESGEVNSMLIGWNIIKILFSGLGVYITLILFIIPSMVLLEDERPVKFRLGGGRYGNRIKKRKS